jgi:hypothetical protein
MVASLVAFFVVAMMFVFVHLQQQKYPRIVDAF